MSFGIKTHGCGIDGVFPRMIASYIAPESNDIVICEIQSLKFVVAALQWRAK